MDHATATSNEPAAATAGTLDAQVAQIGGSLSRSIQAVLRGLPGAPLRPMELTRALGINKATSSRLFRAAETHDPIVAAHLMPGPEPLRRLLKAAGRKNVDPEVIRQAEESVRQFEQFIRTVAGDRGGLDMIISGWLPEVREKTELLSKQAMFRGASQLRGYSADLDVGAHFVHPAAHGAKHDYALMSGSIGLRRLRPGVKIIHDDLDFRSEANQGQLVTLDGSAIRDYRDILQAPFCSSPTPRIEIDKDGKGGTHFTLVGDDVGVRSAVDLVMAYSERSTRVRGVAGIVSMPARKAVYDLFLHQDLELPIEPKLEIFDTGGRGTVRPTDPDCERYRVGLMERVNFVGAGLSQFRCADIPDYIEMIQHVCGKMKWDPSDFRCYRCVIDYPMYGSQNWVLFDRLQEPTARAEPHEE